MKITFRPAVTADFPALTELFRARDDATYDEPAVMGFVCELDPRRCSAWLAFDGENPVGMSMVYHRVLRTREREFAVGYWGNLFVKPQYRKAMVYPKLPLAMFRGCKELGLDFVFTFSRRSESSKVSVALGCTELGTLPVLAKPLRPATLVAARKSWPYAARLAARPADAAFGLTLRAYAAPDLLRTKVRTHPLDEAGVERMLSLRNGAAGDRVHETWTLERYRLRYSHTLQGDTYRLLLAYRDRRTVAGVVWRPATREGMKLGALMDLACDPGHERELRAALHQAELTARSEGAQAMLHLDGVSETTRKILRRLGYIKSPEAYAVLGFPRDHADLVSGKIALENWYLTFADHDAL